MPKDVLPEIREDILRTLGANAKFLTENDRVALGMRTPVGKEHPGFVARLFEGSSRLLARRALRDVYQQAREHEVDPAAIDLPATEATVHGWYERQLRFQDDRREVYRLVEEMDQHSIVSSALDVLSEDSTQPDHDDGHGRRIWIEAPDEEVRKCYMELLDRLNADELLPAQSRALAKYGDQFEQCIYGSAGIVALDYVHAARLSRVQKREGTLAGFTPGILSEQDLRGPKLIEELTGKQLLSRPWDFLHGRLLGMRRETFHGTSVLMGARRSWRMCLAAGTPVWTTAGPVAIENVRPGAEVYCHDPETSETAETAVVGVQCNGVRQLLRVRTAHRQIVVTPDHRMLVRTRLGGVEYKEAKDLISADGAGGHAHVSADALVLPHTAFGETSHTIRVDGGNYRVLPSEPSPYEPSGVMSRIRALGLRTSPRNAHTFLRGDRAICHDDYLVLRDNFELPSVRLCYRHSTKQVPLDVDDLTYEAGPEFMRLFGFMLGDGWVRENTVCFALGVRDDENRYYIDLFKKLFDVGEPTLKTYDPAERLGGDATFQSTPIADIFRSAGFVTGFANKVVPEWVFGMSRESKRELIRGLLDADGGRQDNGWRLSLSNKRLVEQVVMLCQQAGFGVSRETAELIRTTELPQGGSSWSKNPTYRVWITNDPSDDAATYEKVLHVEPAGEGEVYDVAVADGLHNFVAGGVVVHNCAMTEDAVTHGRLIGGPRRVFYVDVGGATPEQQYSIVERWRKGFKKKQMLDPSTGFYRADYNPFDIDADIWWPTNKESGSKVEQLAGCFTGDTRVALLSGKSISFEELVATRSETPFYVYACDAGGNVVVGKAHHPRVTKFVDRLVEVELDNGETVRCTPDHRFMLRDGSYAEAKDLTPGTSLMPLYRRDSVGKLKDYEQVFNPATGSWKFTHRIVGRWKYGTSYTGNQYGVGVMHHDDIRKKNNDPDNLVLMTQKKHIQLHAALNRQWHAEHPEESAAMIRRMQELALAPAVREKRRRSIIRRLRKDAAYARKTRELALRNCRKNGAAGLVNYNGSDKHKNDMRRLWGDPSRTEFRERHRAAAQANGRTHGAANFAAYNASGEHAAKVSGALHARWRADLTPDVVLAAAAGTAGVNELARKLGASSTVVSSRLKSAGLSMSAAAAQFGWRRSGIGGRPRRNHSVAAVREIVLDAPVAVYDLTVDEHHNFALSNGVFVHNSGDPGELLDLKYLRDSLCGALKVPKGFMGMEEDINAKATLEAQDVRFARSVKKIQAGDLAIWVQACRIHGALKNGLEFAKRPFTVRMASVSMLDDLQRSEKYKMLAELTNTLSELGERMGLDKVKWNRHLLVRFMGLSEKQVSDLSPAAVSATSGGGEEDGPTDKHGELNPLPDPDDPTIGGKGASILADALGCGAKPRDLAALAGALDEHKVAVALAEIERPTLDRSRLVEDELPEVGGTPGDFSWLGELHAAAAAGAAR